MNCYEILYFNVTGLKLSSSTYFCLLFHFWYTHKVPGLNLNGG